MSELVYWIRHYAAEAEFIRRDCRNWWTRNIALRRKGLIFFMVLLFGVYCHGITRNPPGFFIDETTNAYNAWLVSTTGAGEMGSRFPLFFRQFNTQNPNPDWHNPLVIYSVAAAFLFTGPSITVARTVAALWIFSACLGLGLLAKRISGQLRIGIIVAGTALVTPWLFEMRGLSWEVECLPLTMTFLMLVIYRLAQKNIWDWKDVFLGVMGLTLVTYSYGSGRILGPLLAAGLLLLVNSKRRLYDLCKIYAGYLVLALAPLIQFGRAHPGALTWRLWCITYLRRDATWKDYPSEFLQFAFRYFEDLDLTKLLFKGNSHAMLHVQGSGGPVLFATFVLMAMGVYLAVTHNLGQPFWRFSLYTLLVSIVPNALTNEPFHPLRLSAYVVLLLLFTVPALSWLLMSPTGIAVLIVLLIATGVQAAYFQRVFWRDGPRREVEFEVPYRTLYRQAVAQPVRPIYLGNGGYDPSYIHAYWYATLEDRPLSEFVRITEGGQAPPGAIVLRGAGCQSCFELKRL